MLKRAKDSDFVGSLMDDLTEPPPPNAGEAIPFLGETKAYESILDIAAEGDLVLNVSGTWIGRRAEDATDEDARRYIRSKAFRTGQEMRQIQLGLPVRLGVERSRCRLSSTLSPNLEAVQRLYPAPPLNLEQQERRVEQTFHRSREATKREERVRDRRPSLKAQGRHHCRQSRSEEPKKLPQASTSLEALNLGESLPANPSRKPGLNSPASPLNR